MKTKYKHIYFVNYDGATLDDKLLYRCENNKTTFRLGTVSFYAAWQKWVFCAESTAVFDESCLKDVIHFMSQL